MSPVFMLIAYLIQGYALFVQIKKGWVLGYLSAAYFLICMLAYDYVVIFNLQNSDFIVNDTSFSALPLAGVSRYAIEARLTFVGLSLLTLFTSIGGPAKAVSANRNLMAQLATRSQEFTNRNRAAFTIGLGILFIINVVHLFSMDLSLVWLNSSYLAIKTADEIGISNPFMAVYHELLRILVLPAILGVFAFSGKSQSLPRYLCLFFCAYGVTIMLAGSSRWVALYGVFAILGMQAFGKLTRTRTVIAVIWTFVAFEYAIYSRSLNDFGLSRIIPNLQSLDFEFVSTSFRGVVVNAFEGALNYANGMMIAPSYSQAEQILSISPLPNFVDGYDRRNSVLINPYAPMGGLGEIMFFNPVIQSFIVCFYIYLLRMAYIADRQANAFVRYAVAMAATYAIYILPSYSFRTSWKIFVLVAVGLVIWNWLRKSRPVRENSQQGYRY